MGDSWARGQIFSVSIDYGINYWLNGLNGYESGGGGGAEIAFHNIAYDNALRYLKCFIAKAV
jgi:hypothetical protein